MDPADDKQRRKNDMGNGMKEGYRLSGSDDAGCDFYCATTTRTIEGVNRALTFLFASTTPCRRLAFAISLFITHDKKRTMEADGKHVLRRIHIYIICIAAIVVLGCLYPEDCFLFYLPSR